MVYAPHSSTSCVRVLNHRPIVAMTRYRHCTLTEVFAFMHRSTSVEKRRKQIRSVLSLSILFLFWLFRSTAFGESPAPSVHWGSLAFPDQYSTLTTGLTLNRFTPIDGAGATYDSTVPNTLGFNLLTFSWTQHGHDRFEGWSINLTGGIGPTSNQPSEFFSKRGHSPAATPAAGGKRPAASGYGHHD